MIRIKPKITSDEATEAKLLKQLKAGSYEAFATVYRRYSPRLYRTVSYLLGNKDVAEDIVQDLFLTIWERRENIDPEKNFEGYVAVIARNLAYRYVMTRCKMIYNIDIAADELADDSANDAAEATSLNHYIMRILDSQPRMRRKVFMMSRFDNLTYAEIASRLDISERTVEAHIYAMVRELKKLLGYVPAAVASLLCLSVKLY